MNTFDFERAMQLQADVFYNAQTPPWIVDRDWAGRRFDCILGDNNQMVKVEEKFVKVTKPYKFGLIEIVQDVATNNMGWYFKTECDFLHWFECQRINSHYRLSRLYRLHWGDFRRWFERYLRSNGKQQNMKVVTEGFGLTLNLIFPWAKCIEDVQTCEIFNIED
jgi:hypothetical protein